MAYIVATPSMVLKNLVPKDIRIFGMKIKPGQSIDLFKSVVGLTEDRVINAMNPGGEIRTKIDKREMAVVSSTFSTFVNDISTEAVTEIQVELAATPPAQIQEQVSGDIHKNRQTHSMLLDVVKDVEQIKSNMAVLSSASTASVKKNIAAVYERLDHINSQIDSLQAMESKNANQLKSHLFMHDTSLLRFSEALSGNIKLSADAYQANISASQLNSAATGTFTKTLIVSLVSEIEDNGTTVTYVHPWAILPAIVTSEKAADPDIHAPSVSCAGLPTTQFISGVLTLTVTFDTDAGATKTYARGDSLSVVVKVSADGKLLGWTIEDFTMTYNIV